MSGGYPLGPALCNGTDIGTSLTNIGTQTTNGLNAFGSWVQLTASSPIDVCWIDVSLFPTNNSSTRVAWQIGVGAAGSEKVIIDSMVDGSNTGSSDAGFYSFPISIPAGTRIAVRSAGSAAADAGNFCNVRLYDGDFFQEGAAGVDALGFVAASTTGTTVTAGTPTGTKGSYAQIVASTSRDYFGFFLANLNASSTTDKVLFDIAIGAAGSEQIIVPNLGLHPGGAGSRFTLAGPFFIPVPAGSRIAMRADSGVLAGTTSDNIIYGLYQ